VDYFLFDLQEGYCDYYASAMVVMARAVGVPARLASGYAQGTYDPAAGRWVITELNGHSWVEVYFEEIGWVEFEPTAGLAALERRGGDELPVQGTLPLPPRRAPWWQAIPWTLLLLATAILALLGFIVWLWRPRPAAAALIRDRQARLLRWGTRLRRPIRDGQTPLEYARHLSAAVRDSSQRASLSRTKSAGQQAPAEIEQLSDAYTRARYSPHPVAERDGWTIRDLWSRLRRHLWWLWLTARPGSTAGSKAESRRDDRP
jgi:hypothetical protein